MPKHISDLPSALGARDELTRRTAGKRLAVFLDYDGTLTPIAERPERAVLSESMREILRALAKRCTVAVISGRDLNDVRNLVGIENLTYAGSHGFDIATPDGKEIHRGEKSGFHDVIGKVEGKLRHCLDSVDGVLIENKRSSVAIHYRTVAEGDRDKVGEAVKSVLEGFPELRVMSGKMVYEIQPSMDWDKGKAVLWMLEAMGLDGDDVTPVYMGDDITDEDAFKALSGSGVGIFVGDKDDPEVEHRTFADFIVKDPEEVGILLQSLAERR